jgi:hypothetical protein
VKILRINFIGGQQTDYFIEDDAAISSIDWWKGFFIENEAVWIKHLAGHSILIKNQISSLDILSKRLTLKSRNNDEDRFGGPYGEDETT